MLDERPNRTHEVMAIRTSLLPKSYWHRLRRGSGGVTVTDHNDYFEDWDQRMAKFDREELLEGMQGALNEVIDGLLKGDDAIRFMVEALQ
jgi:hypothetical protein